jgi:hypothetical protein
MVDAVTITGGSPTSFTVTLTDKNVSVAYRMANPVIAIPTPRKQGATPGYGTVGASANVFTINLAMITQYLDLTFTLTDGCGSFEFTNTISTSTNFEKLGYMSASRDRKNKITVTINNRPIKCEIVAFNVGWEPGRKDLAIGCRMSLIMDVVVPK